MQLATGRVCGRVARYGALPAVKAYTGPLPRNERGIQFETDLPPHPGTVAHLALWYLGQPGVQDHGNGLVCIPVDRLHSAQEP